MLTPRIRSALVVLAASAGLAGCTNLGPYGGIGVGVGSGYGSYGSYGHNPYYGGYGYGNPYGYYGWYDGFYYPGAGYWVYDPDGTPRPINERQSAYWRNMLEKFREARGTAQVKENWSAFRRPAATAAATDTTAGSGLANSVEQRRSALRQRAIEQRAQDQQARAERQQMRSERQEARQQVILEQRETRRVRRGSSKD